MTTLTNEERECVDVVRLDAKHGDKTSPDEVKKLIAIIERLSASPIVTPLTRRDDLHNVIARIMKQPVYNSAAICDAVEQYLERLPVSPTAPKGEA